LEAMPLIREAQPQKEKRARRKGTAFPHGPAAEPQDVERRRALPS
jgi:hypothetical protein